MKRTPRLSMLSASLDALLLGLMMSAALPALAQSAKPVVTAAANAATVPASAVPAAAAPVKEAALSKGAVSANPYFADNLPGPLMLNGWGTRKRLGFDVYRVGFYAAAKSSDGTDHMSLAKPSRLVIRFARELENEQFTRILLAAMRERINMSESQTMVDSMLKFSEVFSSVPVFKVNDEVTLSLFPGGRMEFAINGDAKNFKPLTEPGLARALLSIYVGNNPVDADLKRNLLEGGPKPGEGVAKAVPGGPRR